jgi:hypothetical protein
MIRRQLNIFMASSLKVGYVDILILYNVYMTREVSLLNKTFNGYSKSLASRMFAKPKKSPTI